MTHPFEKYFKRHGHYPQLKLDNGYQRLKVEFAPGYVRLTTYPSGQTLYIRRSTFLTLLRRSVPLARKWPRHPDHDVPAAMHEAFLEEAAFAQALRREKKTRHYDQATHDEQQRRRYQRAKARAARRQNH